jgi:2-oxoglutarate dehydrogenase E1 component
MDIDSLLTGENAWFVDQKYQAWTQDPSSVTADWRGLFAGFGPAPEESGQVAPPSTRSIFNPRGTGPGTGQTARAAAMRQARTVQLINAYRVRGHMLADIDPLKHLERTEHPELTPEWWGLQEADMDLPVSGEFLHGSPEQTTPRQILAALRTAWCGSIGAECMNIQSQEQKFWVIEQLENLPGRTVIDKDEELWILGKLCDAEGFEQYLHARFPGTKRFSLEGAETLIPLLSVLIEEAAGSGVREIVIGMAHRGRLNVLANILEKPVQLIVSEFEDSGGTTQGSGDVKYHLGYSAETVTRRGDPIHLSLTFNPSHLEAVDPVVEGRVRAKQDRHGDTEHVRVMPLLLHGDSAFSGQGLVAEVLNLSELDGYRTGGTIHVIVNNQIGFTTPPRESRSTPYATDVARMLAIPIFHVNGEDPVAVAAVVQVAVAWRQRFHRDVVIDMYCYRKYGHNEGDEPSFTQPLIYKFIRSKPSPRQAYARRMVELGHITQAEADRIFAESRSRMAAPLTFDDRVERGGEMINPLKEIWHKHTRGKLSDVADTGFDLGLLQDLLEKVNTLPEDFNAHPKIRRLLKQRLAIARGQRPVDWAVAEQAVYATLVVDGHPVRLSGQDCGRGTFSHRHAVFADIETGREIYPIQHLWRDQANFRVVDSSLSEAGVLGFEFGYSLDYPEALVMWEAQFGDFANGAQVIIDQFITSTHTKWNRLSGLVMLLPHGYEGQGPEHSSAHPERYLLACAEDNMQVANVTTPANFFHLLRRQVIRHARRPLVVLTPKSLLRHPECVSTLEELANGAFQEVIGEPEALDESRVRRAVFCSGKIYYDLIRARREKRQDRVAIIRVEQWYPFPFDELVAEFDRYPGAEVVWCQEEPRNMGPWPVFCDWLRELLPRDRQPRYVGRVPSAAPATGSSKVHKAEQAAIVDAALDLEISP